MTTGKKSKPKIQLPWVEDEMRRKESVTNKYWNLSRQWNDRQPSNLTVMKALTETNEILQSAPPESLRIKAEQLKDDLIAHGSKKHKPKTDNKKIPRIAVL